MNPGAATTGRAEQDLLATVGDPPRDKDPAQLQEHRDLCLDREMIVGEGASRYGAPEHRYCTVTLIGIQ